MIKIKSNNRPVKKRTMYVCNRKRCDHCAADCHHTADINFALYEEHTEFYPGVDYTVWEKIRHGT